MATGGDKSLALVGTITNKDTNNCSSPNLSTGSNFDETSRVIIYEPALNIVYEKEKDHTSESLILIRICVPEVQTEWKVGVGDYILYFSRNGHCNNTS